MLRKKEVLNSINNHINKFSKIRGYKSKKHAEEIKWINEYFNNIELYYVNNLLEKIWVLIHDDYIHYCPDCGKIPQFRNFNTGYSKHCKKCGRLKGAKKSALLKKEKSPKIIVYKYCKECNEEFNYESKKLNNTINKKFCSKSCAQTYHHKYRSIEDKKIRIHKINKTNEKKYGDKWVINSKYARKKTKQKLGVKYPFQRKDIINKGRKTLFQRTGYTNPLHNPETVQKMIDTKIKKYGDLLSPMYKYKEYIMPSGKVYKVQGNEPKALNLLLKTFKEEDIIISRPLIEKEIGKIQYLGKDEKTHYYYPDIYIKSINKIIEVKSNFTYNINIKINHLKRQACINNGLNFEFMLIN